MYIEWEMVLEYVECLLYLILSYEALEIHGKILFDHLIGLLVTTAFLDDLGNIVLDGTSLMELGLGLECLS
jgi:hypothetical protein